MGLFLILLLASDCLSSFGFEFSRTYFQKNSWDTIAAFHTNGSLKGMFTYYETVNILTNINSNFPDLVSNYLPIGSTFNKKTIYAISFCSKIARLQSNGEDTSTLNIPSTLFTGLLHGNEAISVNMCIYLMNRLIYGFVNKDPAYVYLLENREIWFIPVVNIDTYYQIETTFASTKQIIFLRKNRRSDNFTNVNDCGEYGSGVDLDCNFAYQFNATQTGCSSNPCNPYYRGTAAFSEPETNTINTFLKQYSFKVAVNYFSPYNLILTPYNYLSSINNNSYIQYADYYELIENEATFPTGFQFGQAIQLLSKSYDGDISDYMLNNFQIMALDYYLGDNNDSSEVFFPDSENLLSVLSQNLPSALYFIEKSGDFLKFSALNQFICDSSVPECTTAGLDPTKYLYQLSLANTGFQATTQTTEVLIYFSSPSIYVVETAFLRSSETTYTQLPVTTKLFDNSSSYYSVQIKAFLEKNTTYVFEAIIEKNPNNNNFATFPQRVTFWVGNYYTNNFIPFTGLINHVNFDLENQKPKEPQSEFQVRFESYVILIIFCCIAFGFLIVFVLMNLFLNRKNRKNRVAFQPLDKAKNEVLEPHNELQTPQPQEIELTKKNSN